MNVRPLEDADLDDVLALLVADEEAVHGAPSRIGRADLEQWLSTVDLPTGTWLYEDEAGAAAVGWAERHGDVAVGVGVVHPRLKGTGLGPQLVDRSEARGRELAAARMHQITLGGDRAAGALMHARGYREVRRFYDMAIALGDEPPSVPEDVEIELLREEEAPAFYAAMDEAFQDHWEHHSRGFDEWWDRHRASANFDLSLWFLIRDGEEVVAVARNEANRNGGGYVGALGVRRPWRGRGYAKALLRYTFAEFHRRGLRRVTLGVDAENPTGATHLYERVGMHVEQENVVYEKALA